MRAPRMRTCIATRRTVHDSELLRVVARTDVKGNLSIVPDPKRRLPGRGAWITPTSDHVDTAVARRAFARALKVPHTADTTAVVNFVRSREAASVPTVKDL